MKILLYYMWLSVSSLILIEFIALYILLLKKGKKRDLKAKFRIEAAKQLGQRPYRFEGHISV